MSDNLDQLAINTIRTLSIDAVQQANSGHPATPMALAPAPQHRSRNYRGNSGLSRARCGSRQGSARWAITETSGRGALRLLKEPVEAGQRGEGGADRDRQPHLC
jgi:Transketolase, thiamine diphosphate binding domain